MPAAAPAPVQPDWKPDDWVPEGWSPAEWAPPPEITSNPLGDEEAITPEVSTEEANVLSLVEEPARKPWYVLLLPSLVFAGVQLPWGVQIGRTSPHLREMGLSDRFIGLAWLAGPVSGIVVQPIVGVLSDRCRSTLGRRRPYMIVGTILVCLSLLLFAFSGDLAALLGDPVELKGNGSKTGLIIALIGFWVLDFCINMLQSPTRAVIADILPSKQITQGYACFAFANGAGKTLAYILGAAARDIRIVFSITAGCMILLALLPSILIRGDKPAPPPDVERRKEGFCGSITRTASEIGLALRSMPHGFRPVFITQFFMFVSFMLLFIYASIYFAQLNKGVVSAPKGSPGRLAFEEGVMYANIALVLMSVVSMVVALAIPLCTRIMGTRLYWGSTNFIVGVALICLVFEPPIPVAIAIVASVGITLSNAMSIPWSLTASSLKKGFEDQRGLFFAVFNLSQAVPGLFSSFLGSLTVHLTNGNLTAPLVLAGIASILAAFTTICVSVPNERKFHAEHEARQGLVIDEDPI